MISKIGPLVEAGRRNLLILHVLGGILGGATVGVLLGSLGVALERVAPGTARAGLIVGVPLVLTWAALSDLRLMPIPMLNTSRQTPGSWPCALGEAPASFAWAFHLGLGLGTRVPHQALCALPLAALLIGDLWFAVTLMASYGLARALVVVGAIVASQPQGFAHTCDAILKRKKPVRLAVVSMSIYVAVLAVTSAW